MPIDPHHDPDSQIAGTARALEVSTRAYLTSMQRMGATVHGLVCLSFGTSESADRRLQLALPFPGGEVPGPWGAPDLIGQLIDRLLRGLPELGARSEALDTPEAVIAYLQDFHRYLGLFLSRLTASEEERLQQEAAAQRAAELIEWAERLDPDDPATWPRPSEQQA